MPSIPELDRLSQRRMRNALTAAVVVIVVLLGFVVVLLRRETPAPGAADGKPTTAARPSATAPSPQAQPSAQPTRQPSGPYVQPQRWVDLPEAGDYVDFVYRVRHPHTPEGAVATAASMYQYVWDLEADQAMRAVDVYVAPEIRTEARKEAGEGAAWFRERMGLPKNGTLPPEAGVVTQPIGVRWQVVDKDNVYASVDMKVDLLPGGGADMLSAPGASTVHMRWRPDVRGGDWVALRTPAAQMPMAQYAALGTAEFNSEGWMAIRPGD
jgi:hypothetical protein